MTLRTNGVSLLCLYHFIPWLDAKTFVNLHDRHVDVTVVCVISIFEHICDNSCHIIT